MAIVQFILRRGDFKAGDFIAPLARFVKFPIFLESLLERIRALGAQYNIKLSLRTFRMNSQGIAEAKKVLKGKGGIYIWYCHVTGLFYLGSAVAFFGKNGRLTTYLQRSRLTTNMVSRDIAAAMLEHGYDQFTLIIVEEHTVNTVDVGELRAQEQLWMMLYPTLNRSLTVGSNEAQPMSEEERREKSTIVYQYEVDNNGIISGSEQTHYGIKYLVNNGFFSIFSPSIILSISYFDLNPLLTSGGLYNNRFLFTTTRLTGDVLANWAPPFSYLVEPSVGESRKGKLSSIYVYTYCGPDHLYTEQDLVKVYPSVGACLKEYSIPQTSFLRLRRYRTEWNGLMFSNDKLH